MSCTVFSALNASCRSQKPHQPVWARLVAALSLVTGSEKEPCSDYCNPFRGLKDGVRHRRPTPASRRVGMLQHARSSPSGCGHSCLIFCEIAAKRSGVSAQRESVARRTPAASEALVQILSFVFEYNGQDLVLSRLQRLCWCQLQRRSDRYC